MVQLLSEGEEDSVELGGTKQSATVDGDDMMGSGILPPVNTFVWGSNTHGQLGLNPTTDFTIDPIPVQFNGLTIKLIACGRSHVLF